MEEQLKEISGYRKEYRVSERGNIYGIHGKLLKQKISKDNRAYVGIKNLQNKQQFASVARIVAIAFCTIPNDLKDKDISNLEVHHKDRNTLNNNYQNLMWVSKEKHMLIHKNKSHNEKCVAQIKGNTIVGLYNSISDASKTTGIPIQLISDVVNKTKRRNGKYYRIRKHAGGFFWTNNLEGDFSLSLHRPMFHPIGLTK